MNSLGPDAYRLREEGNYECRRHQNQSLRASLCPLLAKSIDLDDVLKTIAHLLNPHQTS
jgi:hypothetical protein